MKKMLAKLKGRTDLFIIANWIENNSRVLDLGCGNGELLQYLIDSKNVHGMGVDIDFHRIASCIEKGIPVVEHNLNESFSNFSDNSFDFVILSQTIQEVQHPDNLIDEILRIGKYGIVSFPNFGHFNIRAELFFRGRMPKTKLLPFEWYNTPNIRLLTFDDFKAYCKKSDIKILKKYFIFGNSFRDNLFFPNFFSEGCAVLLTK